MTPATLIVAGLANGSIYSLVALALVLIYKTQDVINFGQGEFLMVGGFIGYAVLAFTPLPYPLALLAAILAGGLLGAFIERTALRRVAEEHHITLAMVTVGFSVLIKGLARVPFGSDIYTFPVVIDAAPVSIAGAQMSPQSLITIGLALMVALLLYLFFRLTSAGKQMQATQQNLTGARIVGINPARVFALTWALAAAIGALTGVLAAPLALLYPDMGSDFLLKGFAAAVLGGLESVPGAIIGGFIVGIIEMLFGGYVSTSVQQISSFIVIIAVLLIRPYGLFGRRPVHRV
jgi:branched-chain amino acid transport system permease protein